MTRTCPECGSTFELSEKNRRSRKFCDDKCRLAFNNRRQARGVELYDLFMAVRCERGMARARGYWTLMCRMVATWREEDQRERDGRQSWYAARPEEGRYTRYNAVVLTGSRR